MDMSKNGDKWIESITANEFHLQRNAEKYDKRRTTFVVRFLKNYSEKFTGQKVLGKYIADFYGAKANIVIELDGSQHEFILTLRKTYVIIKLKIV